jgi:N-acylneuraminate cytidylyltransferase/CMP-N,N'-diacetyllegionaminic acid synthase
MDKNKFIFPYSPKFKINTRRQKLRELYFPEGTIYASKVNELIKRKTFYHKRSLAYIVPKWKSFEVDDIVDFICIEAMMNNLEKIKANSKDV